MRDSAAVVVLADQQIGHQAQETTKAPIMAPPPVVMAVVPVTVAVVGDAARCRHRGGVGDTTDHCGPKGQGGQHRGHSEAGAPAPTDLPCHLEPPCSVPSLDVLTAIDVSPHEGEGSGLV
jgi:hypothetical protein